MDTEIEHRDGVPWWEAPAPSRRHRHEWQTRGWMALDYIERCRCGAASEDGQEWFMIGRDKPRVRLARWRVLLSRFVTDEARTG